MTTLDCLPPIGGDNVADNATLRNASLEKIKSSILKTSIVRNLR
jgi:hypothetical protein